MLSEAGLSVTGLSVPRLSRARSTSALANDGTTEILGALAAGATVAIADDTSARDPMALVELVDRHAVDQVTAVPSLARALVDLALESRGTDNPVTDSP
ncbi:AMP-binding protein, partial [Gordonia sp. 852002-10350_SCH5691597]|uniref:AMP-binding protein n=1 Tax=Gordonia sp. 852002-10350_SCH5691597 TaxID=1834085 RepID=UPI0018D44863